MKASKTVRRLVGIGVLAMATAGLLAQGARFVLDEASLAEAITDERGFGSFQFSLTQANLSRGSLLVINGAQPDDYRTVARSPREAPFQVSVLTPYMRASVTVMMARRRQLPMPELALQPVNDDGIVVSVAASQEYAITASLQDLVLRRADDADAAPIQPFKRLVEPQTIKGPFGGERQVMLGSFYFRFEDFEHLPLLITCVGSPRGLALSLEEGDLVR